MNKYKGQLKNMLMLHLNLIKLGLIKLFQPYKILLRLFKSKFKKSSKTNLKKYPEKNHQNNNAFLKETNLKNNF